MNRRLSQIPNKTNYPYPLPNGHAALQLRLPDLLIYLKTNTYLMDVNTGEHYAVYSDKIQKMSVTPKLYSAWGYRQLLHIIQSNALRFGVNSPQPSTSGVSQKASMIAGLTQPSPVSHYPQQPASPCRPTTVKYEPPAFSLEMPTQMLTRDEQNQVLQNHIVAANAVFNKVAVFEELIQREPHNAMYYKEVQWVQKNQHIHVAIKLQHILETDDEFWRAAGLPRLDIPEHLFRQKGAGLHGHNSQGWSPVPATERKRYVHCTFCNIDNQQLQIWQQCALSADQSGPEVISPGHGPVATKFLIKPTRWFAPIAVIQ